jgi:hypothetical protein
MMQDNVSIGLIQKFDVFGTEKAQHRISLCYWSMFNLIAMSLCLLYQQIFAQ